MTIMNPFRVFQAQTEGAISGMYVLVVGLLFVVLWRDCKVIITLLFKKIHVVEWNDEDDQGVEISQNSLIIQMILGIFMYCAHRLWRINLQNTRCEKLKNETAFTDTHELRELKEKLVEKIDFTIKHKIIVPVRRATEEKAAAAAAAAEAEAAEAQFTIVNEEDDDDELQSRLFESENSSGFGTPRYKRPKI